MELKMELVTETQGSLRHTAGVPGRGQGQEAGKGQEKAVGIQCGWHWGAMSPPQPQPNRDGAGWSPDFYRETISVNLQFPGL